MGETQYADAPWGVRNLLTGTWRGCPGTATVSHQAALALQTSQPFVFKAERNPADVLAESLDSMSVDMVMERATRE